MLNKNSIQQLIIISAWIVSILWSTHPVNAAPMPQASDTSSNGTYTNGTVDPFTTPDYLAPSTFTWEQGVYGVLFLLFGAIEVLHGYKYIRFTMLLAGFLVWSSTAVMIILIVDVNTGVYQSSGVYFALWLLVGIIGAIASFFLWHVGIILTGAYGLGVVVALIFTAANETDYVFRYTVLAIAVVVGGYLTRRYERVAVIVATSFGGAYCMMFGLDMFVQTGFRVTFHVMLSQSTAAFDPVPGTWVMIACVPVIAAFGIIWELKHHEQPAGSWWFGHGAKPLPPLPGEKPPRRCCGFLVSLSAKKAAARKLSAGGLSDTTLVPPKETSKHFDLDWAFIFPCVKHRTKSTTKPIDAPSSTAEPSTTKASDENVIADEKSAGSSTGGSGSNSGIPLPVEKAYFGPGHETIGHTGVHKVVINRESREFSLDLEERL